MEGNNIKQLYLLEKALDMTSKSFGYASEYMNGVVPTLKTLVVAGDMTAAEAFAKIKQAMVVELVHLNAIEQTLQECGEES